MSPARGSPCDDVGCRPATVRESPLTGTLLVSPQGFRVLREGFIPIFIFNTTATSDIYTAIHSLALLDALSSSPAWGSPCDEVGGIYPERDADKEKTLGWMSRYFLFRGSCKGIFEPSAGKSV